MTLISLAVVIQYQMLMDNDKNAKIVPGFELAEVVLVLCILVDNQY